MEEIYFSETLVDFQWITRRYTPESRALKQQSAPPAYTGPITSTCLVRGHVGYDKFIAYSHDVSVRD